MIVNSNNDRTAKAGTRSRLRCRPSVLNPAVMTLVRFLKSPRRCCEARCGFNVDFHHRVSHAAPEKWQKEPPSRTRHQHEQMAFVNKAMRANQPSYIYIYIHIYTHV